MRLHRKGGHRGGKSPEESYLVAPASDAHYRLAGAAFGEERRRTKVIPHAFGERALIKLLFAALMRASQT